MISLTNRYHTRDGQWPLPHRFMRLAHMAQLIATEKFREHKPDLAAYFLRKGQRFEMLMVSELEDAT